MRTRITLSLILLLVGAAEVRAQECVASTPVQPTIAPGKCAEGYVLQYGVLGEECFDSYSREQDIAVLQTGIRYSRDGRGNITSIYKIDLTTGATTEHVVEFGGYDEYGRPGWYFDPTLGATISLVEITWPANGACQYSALTATGWTSKFAWADPELVASINTPIMSRNAVYTFNYYPDGNLHMATSEVALYVSRITPITRLSETTAYSETGEQIGYSKKFLPPQTSTSAAMAPGTSPATPQPAPDALAYRLQPKVVVRPVSGGSVGVRLLGPLSLLYPTFDYLGKQIGRFYVNAMALASSDQALDDKCAGQLRGDYEACRKFWSDLGLNPDNLPTDDLKAAHIKCGQSARFRHKQCMAQIEPTPLNIPWEGLVGNQANIDCYIQHAADKETCRVATNAKYAGTGGAFPTLYQVDLYSCILSAQRRLAQCQAGQPLSPLELPK